MPQGVVRLNLQAWAFPSIIFTIFVGLSWSVLGLDGYFRVLVALQHPFALAHWISIQFALRTGLVSANTGLKSMEMAFLSRGTLSRSWCLLARSLDGFSIRHKRCRFVGCRAVMGGRLNEIRVTNMPSGNHDRVLVASRVGMTSSIWSWFREVNSPS